MYVHAKKPIRLES